jgi:alpha-glucosidase (family GH31 glycosyl hydrolase)
MFGATPTEVIQKYHNLIGKPVRTPQWALGWHVVAGNMNDTLEMAALVQDFRDNKLPLNGVWMDV